MDADANSIYLPKLLHQLKEQLPAVQRLATQRLPAPATRVVAELLRLLPLLPDFTVHDACPPPPNNFMPPLLLTTKTGTHGTAKLSQGLIGELGLRAGQPANVLPPPTLQVPTGTSTYAQTHRTTLTGIQARRPRFAASSCAQVCCCRVTANSYGYYPVRRSFPASTRCYQVAPLRCARPSSRSTPKGIGA